MSGRDNTARALAAMDNRLVGSMLGVLMASVSELYNAEINEKAFGAFLHRLEKMPNPPDVKHKTRCIGGLSHKNPRDPTGGRYSAPTVAQL